MPALADLSTLAYRAIAPQPVVGVDPSYRVADTIVRPPGTLLSVVCTLVTQNEGGFRRVALRIIDKTNVLLFTSLSFPVVGGGSLQAEDQTVVYTFSGGPSYPQGSAAQGDIVSSLPLAILLGGEEVKLETTQLAADDQWSEMLLYFV